MTAKKFSLDQKAAAAIQHILSLGPYADPVAQIYEVSAAGQVQFSLMIGAADRADCRPETLHEIGGITFSMNPRIVEVLHDYCLIFADGHFLFRGADNTARTLSSILSLSQK